MGACSGKQHRRGNHHHIRTRHHYYEDKLVLDTLQALRECREQDVPDSFKLISYLAEEGKTGYPLWDAKTLLKLIEMLDLSTDVTNSSIMEKCGRSDVSPTTDIFRNVAIVIGLLAARFPGVMSTSMFTEGVQDFLLSNLDPSRHKSLILYSLIALEKFALASGNKEKLLTTDIAQRIKVLEESFSDAIDPIHKQIHFCSQWLLDNIFLIDGRPFSFEICDTSKVNVMLNSGDANGHFKISSDGLKARCDSVLFESVRSTYCLYSGVWFYEVTVLTEGVMQIGWATKDSKFLNDEGLGVGDDEFSFGYDGCRQLLWHNAESCRHAHKRWTPGDVVGLLLDLNKGKIYFYLNGVKCSETFRTKKQGFYAAASLMEMQQAEFNFGSKPFKFKPQGIKFECMNSWAYLSEEEKRILPKPFKKDIVLETTFDSNCCAICYDQEASVELLPCRHRDLCMKCAMQCEVCPMCRSVISSRQPITKYTLV
ncbi:RING finger and SPRY domain-containing protein 1 [Trichoplax sp. H2]|nr:RING finger and SPRY domain-containing protein 1 [Trichoplax sp. H2]|eukprot:RDD47432.1 RING finger and SPRY domain-containing protein 1 [Trichoplax sp. H2]